MTMSERRQRKIEREVGCRNARKEALRAERWRDAANDPALRRLYPLG